MNGKSYYGLLRCDLYAFAVTRPEQVPLTFDILNPEVDCFGDPQIVGVDDC